MSETNPLPDGYHAEVTNTITKCVDWSEPGLQVTRLRLLSEPGHPVWDVSYCHGQLPSGEYVNVQLPFDTIPKLYKGGIKTYIVDWAVVRGLWAKGTGILDNISTLM